MVLQRASLEDYDSIIAFYYDVIERTPDVEKYARWQKGKAPQGSMPAGKRGKHLKAHGIKVYIEVVA